MEYSLYLIALLSVTLACKNCFNEDCDERWGVCNQGCIAGFFGRECIDKCPTNCIGSICHLDGNGRGVCTLGCSPGFFGMMCIAPCLSTNIDNKCDRHTGEPPVCDGSKHGSHCELSCNCSGKVCDNEGTCLKSCGLGLFGLQCDQQCPPNCRMCHQVTGDCIMCKDGFYGDECQHKCPSAISPSQSSKYKIVPGCSVSERNDGTSPQPSLEGSADTDEMDRVNIHYSLATLIIVIIFIVSIFIVKGVKITKRLRIRCIAQDKLPIFMRTGETGPLLEMEDQVVSSNEENKIIQLQDKIRSLEEENLALKNKIDARKGDKDTNHRIKSLEKVNENLERQVTENKNALEQRGITNYSKHHSLTTARNSRFISCVSFVFDIQNYDSKRVHIDEYGHLVNHPHPEQTNEAPRLKIYNGACSNLALPWSGYPQYFEIKAVIDIRKPLAGNDLLLEIALARKEDHDKHHYVGKQLGSYSLTISHCTTHRSVCVNIWQHGKHVICCPNIPNTRSFSLHYGLVYDHQYGRVGFLDITNNCLIHVLDRVDSTSVLWPMFGVYYSHHSTVTMSLVVGNEISMSEGKKVLIKKSLVSF